jgi:predicted nucleic acid-binding protein
MVTKGEQAEQWGLQLRGKRVYFDTNIFIYILENHPEFGETCLSVVQSGADKELDGYCGDLVLAELLVKPLKDNNARAVKAVKDLFTEDTKIELLPHTRSTFITAAHLRANHKIKLPDALHLATAIENHVEIFLTNDRDIPRIPGITVMTLPTA